MNGLRGIVSASRTLAAGMALLLLLSGSGCRREAPPPDTLTFMAGYKPQANLPFVGVYVAQEKGFFAAENLTVTIQHSAGRGEHLQLLTAGKVDVTTQDAAILLQRRADVIAKLTPSSGGADNRPVALRVQSRRRIG